MYPVSLHIVVGSEQKHLAVPLTHSQRWCRSDVAHPRGSTESVVGAVTRTRLSGLVLLSLSVCLSACVCVQAGGARHYEVVDFFESLFPGEVVQVVLVPQVRVPHLLTLQLHNPFPCQQLA